MLSSLASDSTNYTNWKSLASQSNLLINTLEGGLGVNYMRLDPSVQAHSGNTQPATLLDKL